jgi:hypothetical protein
MSTRLRSIVAIYLAIIVLALTPGIASAADFVYHERTEYLTASPVLFMPMACFQRSIYLAAGQYEWGYSYDGRDQIARTIYLGAGDYRWGQCLVPLDGQYLHQSELAPLFGSYPSVS